MGARLIVPGARLRDVCEAVEAEIHRQGAGLAFPVQSSRNEVAAHYCASPEDETLYVEGDLAKLDIGVHVDGWVVDTAVTVNVGDRPENRRLVDAARAALDAAIATAAPGLPIQELSAAIESAVNSYGLRAVRNLCGHGVGRWTVHCPPPIPNVPDHTSGTLAPGAVVAIEPFATDGIGLTTERGAPQVFRLDPARDRGLPRRLREGDLGDVLEEIRALRGLPFARRQLRRFARTHVEEVLAGLLRAGALSAYPPLVETAGRPVAQAEHTVHLGPDGVEVLTL
jgi:methionyl aminopeptidase